MSLEQIQRLLNTRIGLDARSIGVAAVTRAVQARIEACRMAAIEPYWQRVQVSSEELQALIELVVVPETWFFRDRDAFTALTGLALPQWLRRSSGSPMRLLSLPCATGEEPYSIAMALLDAGLAPERFRIDALDVSHRAIEVAERGQYGRNAFRGSGLDFRSRYFEPMGRSYRLGNVVRATVAFRAASLFDDALVASLATYDVVFCRNLLIYFDHRRQRDALQILARLLSPAAMLFVGPSEGALLLDQGFVSARIPRAFCFHRLEGEPRKRPPSLATTPGHDKPAAPLPLRSTRPRAATAAASGGTAAVAHSSPPQQPNGLDAAKRLADEGRLGEALTICEQHLRSTPTADAYCLSALIHDAAGRGKEAQAHYRKALYLDPAHAEALTHLAMALMRHGDASEAQRLLMRAQRARPTES